MKFYVVETLTGKIRGQLYPNTWSLSDPLREVGTGTLTIPLPATRDAKATLRELVWPRHSDGLGRTGDRWVAAEDATGAFVWCGPILGRPTRGDATVMVKLADWRTWFYRAPLRPSPGDYIVKERDQTTIAKELLTRSVDSATTGTTLVPPPFKVVTPALSGVLRDRTLRQLDRSVGDHMDELVDVERGLEWWTYCSRSTSDPTVLDLWVTTAYPERTKRTSGPVRVEWQLDKGGNVAEQPSWPESGETITRMWATGDGEPPAQVSSRSEDTDASVLWEGMIGPLDGVKKAASAYSHAFAERIRSGGYAANAEFALTSARLPFNDVAPGDRARVIYDDGWESYDVPAARIVERVMSGGRDVPELHRLVIDLSDVIELSLDDPGTPGVEEA